MIKFTIPVYVLILTMILFITGILIYYINPIFSIILFWICIASGFFSYIFLIAGKSNIKRDKNVVTILLLIFIILNFVFRGFLYEQSTRLYIVYYKSEITEIRNILFDKGSFSSYGNSTDTRESTVSVEGKQRILALKNKMKCYWIFADSNKIGYNINDRYVIVYSERPIEGCFYDIRDKKHTFETRKLFGKWNYFYLPHR